MFRAVTHRRMVSNRSWTVLAVACAVVDAVRRSDRVNFLVVHCHEELDWIQRFLVEVGPKSCEADREATCNVGEGCLLTVVEKCDEPPPAWLPARCSLSYTDNELSSDEVSGYLTFILHAYDMLAEWTVFLHGKKPSEMDTLGMGNISRLVELVEAVDNGSLSPSSRYVPLGMVYTQPSFCAPWQFPGRCWGLLQELCARFGQTCEPGTVADAAGAQFAVHRTAILAHAPDTYRDLLAIAVAGDCRDGVLHGKPSSLYQGVIFERTWHIIFGMELALPPVSEREDLPLSMRKYQPMSL
eukprot:TRINITY_DN67529_c0_g1_i1.p1 TRINITY_DN67529_c0_g1~~TRINITY_DN67529_c0_g1_i1.p1  ORF type:complete len:298 (+),score=33.39 TRINITY_DN67529_c0_g1_i1:37-930(+)